MKTKLEIFCAYLPYDVQVFFDWMQITIIKKLSGNNLSALVSNESKKLILRPLSLLQTPMQHPVTGEKIENPTEWILNKLGIINGTIRYSRYKDFSELVWHVLTKPYNFLGTATSSFDFSELRQIDALALSLHFDIYNAIEQGFAIEYGAAQ